jgi:glycolate dehydrogenase FAD-binding subunit
VPDISTQLIEQVQLARAQQTPLNICGRASKAFYGREAAGQAVETAGHCGIVHYDPAELVMTVRAGTALSEMDSALAEHGQVLSFEPPSFAGDASIGGTLACNQSGPARPWGGSVRDSVLGIRLINGRGEHLRFGGQVMKNVAGYDVSRMQAGALGCMGVITEISLKVMPQAAASRTMVLQLGDSREAITLMNQLQGKPLPITGLCWHHGMLFVRMAGSGQAVDSAEQQLRREWGIAEELANADLFWRELRDQQQAFFDGDLPLWRFSVGSSVNLPTDHENCLIDWGGSQRWLRGDYEHERLQEQLADIGGEVQLFRHGDRSGEVFGCPSVAVQGIHMRLKASFDPDGLFNPGRLYSWL